MNSHQMLAKNTLFKQSLNASRNLCGFLHWIRTGAPWVGKPRTLSRSRLESTVETKYKCFLTHSNIKLCLEAEKDLMTLVLIRSSPSNVVDISSASALRSSTENPEVSLPATAARRRREICLRRAMIAQARASQLPGCSGQTNAKPGDGSARRPGNAQQCRKGQQRGFCTVLLSEGWRC